MVSNQSTTLTRTRGASTAPLLERAPRVIVMRLMSDQLARRLLTLEEAGPVVGYSAQRLEDFVADETLPALRLPSSSDAPTRYSRRVPVAWLPRWFAMRDRSTPVWTARGEIGGKPGEPMIVSMAMAAAALGLARNTARLLNDAGRCWPVQTAPKGTALKVNVDEFDDWVAGLIREAEELWFGVAAPAELTS